MSKKSNSSDQLSYVRCTFSIPVGMYRNLTTAATVMRISRSALVTQIAQDALESIAIDLNDYIAASCDETTVRRLRGKSVALVEQAYAEFIQDMNGDGEADPTGEVRPH